MKRLVAISFSFGFFITRAVFSECIQTETANLHAGPSLDQEITWVVPKHMPLKRLFEKDGWAQVVDVDNDVHWVRNTALTQDHRCAVVKVDRAKLRTGPGEHFPQVHFLPSIEHYATFIYVKRQESWAQLKDDADNRYWIHRSLIWVY
ncbi:MAG: hypothetical protein HY390_05520 [Deltaproteobacteria bacterium]|nr:hypothetical protein [Deltaproteobacteria bacterium]